MYRKFNISNILFKAEKANNYYDIGLADFAQDRVLVKETLDKFTFEDSSLDGASIQAEWFPQTKADIFISHSHFDERLAITLAGWLSSEFKLKAFVDSCIWNYSNKLLWNLDKKVSYDESKGTFSYEKRNETTSHVHMMLSTALSMMIAKTECLFFLNTPNSLKAIKGKEKTQSPWIYSEIAIAQLLPVTLPPRKKIFVEHLEKGGELESKKFSMVHDLDLKGFVELGVDELNSWEKNLETKTHPLDTLYDLFPPID